jgi:predicted amidophosphoribosyltransferase
VRGCFAVHGDVRLVSSRVLLVDDVLTTGATANECARVLKEAGAEQVGLVTLAAAYVSLQKNARRIRRASALQK